MEPHWQTEDGSIRQTRIYVLVDPFTGEARYVGKTVGTLERRVIQHLNDCNRAHKNAKHSMRWLKSLKTRGQKPIAGLLEIAGEDWADREKAWIEYYRAKGFRLTNATDGGEGLAGLKFSDEHRRKIARARTRKVSAKCACCGESFMRRPSDVERERHSFCSKACYFQWQKGKPKSVGVPPVAAIEAARQKRMAMTTCKRGHPLSGANLRIGANGQRVCIECYMVSKRKYIQKQRHAAC